jgi:hypothetical protein
MAGQKYTDGGNVFRFMKSEEKMAGEDFEPEKHVQNWQEHIFTIGIIKFRQKFWSLKGPE